MIATFIQEPPCFQAAFPVSCSVEDTANFRVREDRRRNRTSSGYTSRMASCSRNPSRRARVLARFLLAAAAASLALPDAAIPLGGPQPVRASVEGEVRKPGTYTLPPGSPLSSLLYAVGGFTDNAFLPGAALTRSSARKAQEAELRETAERFSRETAGSGGGRDAVGPVIRLLSSLVPSGRVPVRMSHPRLLKGGPADIPLEEGDVLRIPAKTDTVSVTGAVQTAPAAVPFAAKLPYGEYIRRAGGYADGADRDRVFLLRADGTTALLSLGFVHWNPATSRWEVTALADSTPAIGPGDTIVVPRPLPGDLPPAIARELPGILMRASEVAGEPVILR
jgi:protein involved in polysaccharide export with SLBB domain